MKEERFQKFAKNHPKAIQKFDRNGDGKLSEDEREAARQEWKGRLGKEKGQKKGQSSDAYCKPEAKKVNSLKYPSKSRAYPE